MEQSKTYKVIASNELSSLVSEHNTQSLYISDDSIDNYTSKIIDAPKCYKEIDEAYLASKSNRIFGFKAEERLFRPQSKEDSIKKISEAQKNKAKSLTKAKKGCLILSLLEDNNYEKTRRLT